ncbi:MAG: SAM-dependent methyltransferase [Planctomycetota bacterium]
MSLPKGSEAKISIDIESFRRSLGDVASRLDEGGTRDRVRMIAEAMMTRHDSVMRMRFGSDSACVGATDRVDWYSLGFYPARAIKPSRTLEYASGDFFLQDAGSLLALAACEADLKAPEPQLVCDLCAAPGGKASGLLESIGDGFLLANETVKSRIPPLAFNLARTGSDRYAISNLDPDELAERIPGTFDLVLADVPCSGQMLLSRGKQSRSALGESQIEHNAMRARRILMAAVKLLRPGGKLVLSTCTFATQENESQVRWLLDSDHAALRAAPLERLTPYLSSNSGCTYRLWPDIHRCAGSFAARMINEAETSNESSQSRTSKRRRQAGRRDTPPVEDLERWYGSVPSRLDQRGDCCYAWPADAPDWTESIACRGPEVAYRTGKTWKPSHDSARSRGGIMRGAQMMEVDRETAKTFLRGEAIPCPQTGWNVVRWEGRGLGGVKATKGLGKNQLPSACRFEIREA